MPVQFLRITFYLRILLLLLKSLLTGCTRRAPGSRFELKHILTCDLLDPLLLLMGYHFAVDNIFFFSVIKLPVGSYGGSDGIDDKPPFRVLAFSFDSVRVRAANK